MRSYRDYFDPRSMLLAAASREIEVGGSSSGESPTTSHDTPSATVSLSPYPMPGSEKGGARYFLDVPWMEAHS